MTVRTASCTGVILTSDLLLDYLRKKYPGFYFVSSTTKVLTGFRQLEAELGRPEFRYVVPDFRLNKAPDLLAGLPQEQKDKVEFLCNEACRFDCPDRKACYENVSRKNRGEDCGDHICTSPHAGRGYRFSDAMENPGFIGIREIQDIYLPNGFSHFKIEGRSLGERHDPGVPAVLYDPAGVSAAGPGGDLPGQFPGSVLVPAFSMRFRQAESPRSRQTPAARLHRPDRKSPPVENPEPCNHKSDAVQRSRADAG